MSKRRVMSTTVHMKNEKAILAIAVFVAQTFASNLFWMKKEFCGGNSFFVLSSNY